jgi:hypothetical protein
MIIQLLVGCMPFTSDHQSSGNAANQCARGGGHDYSGTRGSTLLRSMNKHVIVLREMHLCHSAHSSRGRCLYGPQVGPMENDLHGDALCTSSSGEFARGSGGAGPIAARTGHKWSTIGGGNERGDRETHWKVVRQAGIESATYRFEDSRSGLIARTVGMPKFYRDAC